MKNQRWDLGLQRLFKLIDAWMEPSNGHKVFKFKLEMVDDEVIPSGEEAPTKICTMITLFRSQKADHLRRPPTYSFSARHAICGSTTTLNDHRYYRWSLFTVGRHCIYDLRTITQRSRLMCDVKGRCETIYGNYYIFLLTYGFMRKSLTETHTSPLGWRKGTSEAISGNLLLFFLTYAFFRYSFRYYILQYNKRILILVL